MAARTLLSLAVSLDGFLADADGGVPWLDPYATEEVDFPAFFHTLGCVVMGRRTYDQALGFGAWPYDGLRSVVLTHRPLPPGPAGVEAREGDLLGILTDLQREAAGPVWIMGGAEVMQEALRREAVDLLELNWIPVLLGGGIPLFGPLPGLQGWRLLEHQAYGNGILRARYERGA